MSTNNYLRPLPRQSAARARPKSTPGRRLTVRSDQRQTLDVRKIALAILTLATSISDESEAGSDA